MPPVLFTTESDVSRAPQLSNQRAINCFVERQAPTAKGNAPLFGAPGLSLFASLGGGPVRGATLMGATPYFVSGPDLYVVNPDGSSTPVGAGIAGGSNVVSMANNGTQVCVVDGTNGWIYSVAGGFVQITSAAFYPAFTVNFMDGYFIFDRTGTNEWFLSALYDGTSYNALDFASAEGEPDIVVATVQNLQLLFIFCTTHIELWYDAGALLFPFQRYAGGIINYGCRSPQAIVKQDGAIFFLGSDHIFYRLQANVPIRVSTHYVERIIEQEPDITLVSCLTYTIEGHKMVAVTFPGQAITLEFDISTGKWHERQSWTDNPATGATTSMGRWRGNVAIGAYDNQLVGDTVGNVGIVDWTVYTEFGNTMPMIAQGITQHHDRQRVYVDRLELDVQAGVGLITGQGSDPQVMLDYSRDGGMTWLTQQPWLGMGMQGEYLRRLRWLNLGQGFDLVFRVTITDPVFRCIIACNGDFAVGA